MTSPHPHHHVTGRLSWLRAAVLGANDGIVSTASLMVGVAASHSSHEAVLIAGVAGLVAGAMSMAAGEYVSVQSQADTEAADLDIERVALENDELHEREELAHIYVNRGLEEQLAHEVARQLMAHNALEAHARDELGISEALRARPIQAALASAGSFAVGAALPLGVATLASSENIVLALFLATPVILAAVGAIAARAGGASLMVGAARIAFWGALAMCVTSGVGYLFRL
jgi:VIT1/CCC1 family predicted Fe2+/Mn2+ transporter